MEMLTKTEERKVSDVICPKCNKSTVIEVDETLICGCGWKYKLFFSQYGGMMGKNWVQSHDEKMVRPKSSEWNDYEFYNTGRDDAIDDIKKWALVVDLDRITEYKIKEITQIVDILQFRIKARNSSQNFERFCALCHQPLLRRQDATGNVDFICMNPNCNVKKEFQLGPCNYKDGSWNTTVRVEKEPKWMKE
jgi:hypothetical protein